MVGGRRFRGDEMTLKGFCDAYSVTVHLVMSPRGPLPLPSRSVVRSLPDFFLEAEGTIPLGGGSSFEAMCECPSIFPGSGSPLSPLSPSEARSPALVIAT